jgi:hypothetical protein
LAIEVLESTEREALLLRTLLRDPRFYAMKLEVDRTLLAEARKKGCEICGDALHSADFSRKPRGGPSDLGEEHGVRFSLCCADRECRKRHTPPSLRFLGRKVYLGAVVVLVSAMREGATRARMRTLRDLLGVSRRTVERWREWWRTTFAETRCWREAAQGFVPAVETGRLPASILERFAGDEESRLVLLLRLLAPITGGSAAHAR